MKRTLKPCYVAQKTFDNDLVVIRKIEATLTLKKPAYVGIFMIDLCINSIMNISKTNIGTKQIETMIHKY